MHPSFSRLFRDWSRNGSYCQSQCLGYAFPVYVMTKWNIIFRNLQCALCNGFKPSSLTTSSVSESSVVPPLTILFDFTSSFEKRVKVKDNRRGPLRRPERTLLCASDEVYDPYVGKCKSIVTGSLQRFDTMHIFPIKKAVPVDFMLKIVVSQNEQTAPVDFMSNKTSLLLNLNCTFVAFNQSDYEQRPHGTVYIKPHHKIYGKMRYTISGNILLLCVNFSRNATVLAEQRSTGNLTTTTPTSLQILTLAGCLTSMASLLLLLVTYALFSDLRNLPGRITINLALSLLLYQGVFLAAMKTSSREQCKVIAILLHYFVLCSFTWMNAMAYDVHKTFTSSGKLKSMFILGEGCSQKVYVISNHVSPSPRRKNKNK